MSIDDLELELRRWRTPDEQLGPSGAETMEIEAALAYRDAGNLVDELGRSLRLVLHIANEQELLDLDRKRLQFEPDFHEEPSWRRPGSARVNVVPLRTTDFDIEGREWVEDPEIAALEMEWRETGRVSGICVDGDLRSFVFKTVVALRRAGKEVTRDSILASAARWLSPGDLDKLSRALS